MKKREKNGHGEVNGGRKARLERKNGASWPVPGVYARAVNKFRFAAVDTVVYAVHA